MKKIFITISILFIVSIALTPIMAFASTADPDDQGGGTEDPADQGGQTEIIKCQCPYNMQAPTQDKCTELDNQTFADATPSLDTDGNLTCAGNVWAIFANTKCNFSNVISKLKLSGITQAGDCTVSSSTETPIDVDPTQTPPAPAAPPPADVTLPNFLAKTPGEDVDINEVIGRIVKAIIGISGSAALAVFIYGGVLWMFSGGNQDKIAKGRKAMMYAAIGLAVILLSYTLVAFVLKSLK